MMPGLANGHIPGYGVGIGQRAYYAGHFASALEAYRKEWESGSDRHHARLQRLLANLLTDLGMLSKAEQFARDGLEAQEVSGDHEVYKTRGRLAEIALRSGRLTDAETLYGQSLAEQEAVFGENGLDGQTLTYLGHAACMSNRLEDADNYYQRAMDADHRKDGRLNAYALMGKVALALRRADHDAVLAALAQLEATDRSAINGDSLPCSLIRIAGAPREQGLSALDSLIKDNYVIEALACLPALFNQHGMASKRLGQICERLREWDKALEHHRAFLGPQEPGQPNPRALLDALENMRRRQSLALPEELRNRIFPVNLIVGPVLDSDGNPCIRIPGNGRK
jgi:tetratricopeptide (TPR) repeat protein